jgi:hypothetical protein
LSFSLVVRAAADNPPAVVAVVDTAAGTAVVAAVPVADTVAVVAVVVPASLAAFDSCHKT